MLLKTTRSEGLPAGIWVLLILVMLTTALLCVCVGSVSIPVEETLTVIGKTLLRHKADSPIILSVRLPRVICVALSGAALSLSGVAMQGLLKNPLADGSTLGVSSGASLGAVVAIAFGISIPGLPFAGTTVMAILFAFLSLLLILTLAYKMDYTLSTSTIILIGVIFSMFVSSILSLIVTFAADKIKSITFWTMGSLTVRYGVHEIVKNVSFSVEEGQWFMLVGPNGAGKSTILNAISGGAGYTGHIRCMDKNIKHFSRRELAQTMGILTQGNSVGYGFTVKEVVALGRYAHRGESPAEKEKHIRSAMEITGISDLADKSVLHLVRWRTAADLPGPGVCPGPPRF